MKLLLVLRLFIFAVLYTPSLLLAGYTGHDWFPGSPPSKPVSSPSPSPAPAPAPSAASVAGSISGTTLNYIMFQPVYISKAPINNFTNINLQGSVASGSATVAAGTYVDIINQALKNKYSQVQIFGTFEAQGNYTIVVTQNAKILCVQTGPIAIPGAINQDWYMGMHCSLKTTTTTTAQTFNIGGYGIVLTNTGDSIQVNVIPQQHASLGGVVVLDGTEQLSTVATGFVLNTASQPVLKTLSSDQIQSIQSALKKYGYVQLSCVVTPKSTYQYSLSAESNGMYITGFPTQTMDTGIQVAGGIDTPNVYMWHQTNTMKQSVGTPLNTITFIVNPSIVSTISNTPSPTPTPTPSPTPTPTPTPSSIPTNQSGGGAASRF